MNSAMSDLYTQKRHEIIGKAIYNYEMPKTADVMEHIQYIMATGKEREGEIFYKDHVDHDHFFKYKLAPFFDQNGKIEAIYGVAHEITEQKRAEKKIWQNANYDLLTGLSNRLMFNNKR